MRTLLRAVLAVAALTLLVLVVPAAAGAQTTTTSSIPALPVTGSGPTTTTAPATGQTAAGPDLASTGIDADVLFTLGILLVVIGAAVQAGERLTREPEPRLTIG